MAKGKKKENAGKQVVVDNGSNKVAVYIDNALVCDNCDYNEQCSLKKSGQKCQLANGPAIEKVKDLAPALLAIMQKEMERYMRGTTFEELSGGSHDKNVTQQAENIFKLAKVIKDLSTNKEVVTIKREGGDTPGPGQTILETLLGGKKGGGNGS